MLELALVGLVAHFHISCWTWNVMEGDGTGSWLLSDKLVVACAAGEIAFPDSTTKDRSSRDRSL